MGIQMAVSTTVQELKAANPSCTKRSCDRATSPIATVPSHSRRIVGANARAAAAAAAAGLRL